MFCPGSRPPTGEILDGLRELRDGDIQLYRHGRLLGNTDQVGGHLTESVQQPGSEQGSIRLSEQPERQGVQAEQIRLEGT